MSEQIEKVAIIAEQTGAPPIRKVFKNAALLMGAQVAATPLSLLTNIVIARNLGADDYGLWYLAATLTAFAGLVVEWGHGNVVSVIVARDRSRAGDALGSSLAWRIMVGPVVCVGLWLGCRALGYTHYSLVAIGLSAVGMVIWSVGAAYQDTIRGHERMDVAAVTVVGTQLLNTAIIVPTLLLGGRLRAALCAQVLLAGAAAIYGWYALRSVGKVTLSVRRATMKALVVEGTPFLMLNLSMALQPTIDALFLSKLAPIEAVGWLAAAKKLVGVLVFPASALLTTFYPTLARLWVEERNTFCRTAAVSLRASIALVVPLALGSALYADLGIRVFSRGAFGAAADDLRVLSLFVLFLYFSMILGMWLAASGKSRPWAVVQFFCVVISAAADPILIPYCQRRFGNGGLGVCASTVLSEALMVVCGLWLIPRGILDRSILRALGLAAIAGGAMAAASLAMLSVTPFVAAPLSVAAYAACLWLTGGVDEAVMAMIRGFIATKLGKRFEPR